ncbi:hypothetical protein JHW43_007169 [Diplocarpon mali]|nr:hypothetical protein JHW43_007169 [Diplocarpon mali]
MANPQHPPGPNPGDALELVSPSQTTWSACVSKRARPHPPTTQESAGELRSRGVLSARAKVCQGTAILSHRVYDACDEVRRSIGLAGSEVDPGVEG